MATVNSFEVELKTSIPASKVFHDFVIGFFDFLLKHIFADKLDVKFTNLEGDGGVGTIILMSYDDGFFPSVKYKIKGIDFENFTYSMVTIEGTNSDEHESILSEVKVIPLTDGGCTVTHKITAYDGIEDDEIQSQKDQLAEWLDIFETVTLYSNDDTC